MSNFFTHLISRSFGHEQAAPVVRPCPPSLFESRPTQDIGLFLDAEQPDFLKQTLTTDSYGASSPPPVSHRPSAPPVKRDTRSQRLNTFKYLPHDNDHAADTMAGKTVSTESKAKAVIAAPTPSSPKQATQPMPLPAAPAAEVNKQRPPAADKLEGQSIPKTSEFPPAPDLPETKLPPAMDAPDAEVKPEWTPNRPRQFPRKFPREHKTIQMPGSSHPLSAPSKPVQPTIQVTIGRVEVRAVTPPAPPAKPPRPAPAPSLALDDYLKQRREGRR